MELAQELFVGYIAGGEEGLDLGAVSLDKANYSLAVIFWDVFCLVSAYPPNPEAVLLLSVLMAVGQMEGWTPLSTFSDRPRRGRTSNVLVGRNLLSWFAYLMMELVALDCPLGQISVVVVVIVD